jgi:flavin reductase (DIM6/NTAB) family NADH-FMN oxidoreductase RutF
MANTSDNSDDAPHTETFRAWAGQWAAGVAVVIAVEGEDVRAATVTAFIPVSFDPPLVAVFLNREGRMGALMRTAQRWTVSVLGADHYSLARHFAHPARVTGSEELQRVGVMDISGGPPALADAAAWLRCARESVVDLGDHTAFVGRVTQFERQPDTRPLIAWRGKLHRLGEVAAPANWTALDAADLSADW